MCLHQCHDGVPQERTQQVRAHAFKKLCSLFDCALFWLVKLLPEVKTKGSITLPEKPQGAVVKAAVGAGAQKKGGTVVAPSVEVGDKVLLPEYGGIKYCFRNTVK